MKSKTELLYEAEWTLQEVRNMYVVADELDLANAVLRLKEKTATIRNKNYAKNA